MEIPETRVRREVLALVNAAVLFALSLSVAPAVAEPDAKATMELGRRVFTEIAQPQCGLCHALKDAGTNGGIGAKLEELRPDAKRVLAAVRQGVGVMPSYDGKLTPEQMQAVAYYVSRAVQAANRN